MRAFVAVEIDNKDVLQKIESVQKSLQFKAKPVRIDQVHFTLQFIGEISDEKASQVKNALTTLNFEKFSVVKAFFT